MTFTWLKSHRYSCSNNLVSCQTLCCKEIAVKLCINPVNGKHVDFTIIINLKLHHLLLFQEASCGGTCEDYTTEKREDCESYRENQDCEVRIKMISMGAHS